MCAALNAMFPSARPVFPLLHLLPNKSLPPAPPPARGTLGTGFASRSAMFQSVLLVFLLLLHLLPVLPPAGETFRTMCANRNVMCLSVHPARPHLSHLADTFHPLPLTTLQQGVEREHAAQMVAPLLTGCKIYLAGTSLLESRRMRGWQSQVRGRQAGDRPILHPSRESRRTGTPCLQPG